MWSKVFLEQASSVWQVYEHLKGMQLPACHALHYLQMATEKLAKAYLLVIPTEIQLVLSTHKGLTRFLRNVSRNSGLQSEMGMQAKQLRAHILMFYTNNSQGELPCQLNPSKKSFGVWCASILI